MKKYFTIGPSQVYPTLYKHIAKAMREEIPSLNHRSTEFKALFKATTDNLKELLDIPKNYQIFFVSSALEAMERTIQSCVENYSFHIITGSFGKAWANYASQIGKEILKIEPKAGEKINLDELQIPKQAELICITQNDTSTGFWIDPKKIQKLKNRYPEKLLVLDAVSSVPYVDLNYKYLDVVFFSVQKGFGLPAGLGIIIVSPKALEKTEQLIRKGVKIGSYHNFLNLFEKAKDSQTPETPNVLNIYLLNQVIKDMLKKGIKKIRQETDEKSKVLYNFFDTHKKYSPFIKDLKFRSPTTLVIDCSSDSENLRKKLSEKGFIIASGYGENKLNHIRIGNFPTHSLKNVRQMLKYI